MKGNKTRTVVIYFVFLNEHNFQFQFDVIRLIDDCNRTTVRIVFRLRRRGA